MRWVSPDELVTDAMDRDQVLRVMRVRSILCRSFTTKLSIVRVVVDSSYPQTSLRIGSRVTTSPVRPTRYLSNANSRAVKSIRCSPRCLIGEDHLDAVCQAVVVQDQRAAGLRFGDRRVLALMQTLCLFAVLPTGFRRARGCSPTSETPRRRVRHQPDDVRPVRRILWLKAPRQAMTQ